MPAHVQPNGKLLITAWRNQDIIDVRPAPDGARALLVAVAMLIEMGELQGGDRLDITEAAGETLPAVSAASHFSG